MSRLRIFKESDPATPEFASYDPDFIATELKKIGVTFERWKANKPIEPGASPEEVMDAYRADIDPSGGRARLQDRRCSQHRAGQPAARGDARQVPR